ncbi:GNAT family N-acetyltransferase [Loktanella sp. D2R18]|uniref:GNAT family N-acetyltransferase n=1 Tax=Rhodobacterales TaxID=204455 RepID=UPI000DE8B9A9|nr:MULTISPECIES: GNAT family N-acetyltransferase [Rhodobacterales]MDO6590385.1 GNAT family N-acetyltransferase [Yoonia sp. 1_MG-2023]RBW41114.1 GNAT family N-acetyltransferase [Loktanella sp. D2R18]
MIVRLATPADAAHMTTLLNAIIGVGGSTAHETPFTVEKMLSDYILPPALVCCHVAENAGKVVGFQWLGWPRNPDDPMPKGWGVIASFVAPEAAGMGVGQGLFAATKSAANTADVAVIDATIRADNVAGLRYYGGLGFQDYDRLIDIPLRDGTKVDRIRKRFDL